MQVATVKPILDFNIGGLFDKLRVSYLGCKHNFSSSHISQANKVAKICRAFPN